MQGSTAVTITLVTRIPGESIHRPRKPVSAVYDEVGSTSGGTTVYVCDMGRVMRRRSVLVQIAEGRKWRRRYRAGQRVQRAA